jgi:hypothetical protein
VDQDPLSFFNLRMIKKGLPRSKACKRNRGRLLEVQRMRLGREVRCSDRDEFGSAAIASKRGKCIHSIAYAHTRSL